MTSKDKFTEVQRTKFEVRTKRKDLLSLYADGGKMKHNYLLVLKCSISFEMIKFNQAGLFVLVSTIDRLPTLSETQVSFTSINSYKESKTIHTSNYFIKMFAKGN